MNLLMGKAVTQAIAVMAQFGMADQMKDDTVSSDDIAKKCGAHAGSVYRPSSAALLATAADLSTFTFPTSWELAQVPRLDYRFAPRFAPRFGLSGA